MVKRTTMRSSKGTKLYAVRDKEGRFKDIQTYKRAHTQDMKRKSQAELASTTGTSKTIKASPAAKRVAKSVKKAAKSMTTAVTKTIRKAMPAKRPNKTAPAKA